MQASKDESVVATAGAIVAGDSALASNFAQVGTDVALSVDPDNTGSAPFHISRSYPVRFSRASRPRTSSDSPIVMIK